MNREITWNLLGLSKIKTGIEELAISYLNLTHYRYPQVSQKVYISSGISWVHLIPSKCKLVEIPRNRLDIARPENLGEVSHSWAKCISRSDSKIGGSYTIHDWGPFFDKSISVRQRILWTSTIYRSIIRSETIHFLHKSFYENAPNWAKEHLNSKNIIFSSPIMNQSTKPLKLQDTGNFFLAVGTNIPRKNFKKLTQIWSSSGVSEKLDLKLILIGEGTEVFSQKGIMGLGYVSEKDLNNYIYNCIGLICVSNYEGQNLPIRDALTLRKPVISTRQASLAYQDNEIVKIDVVDEKSLVDSIIQVVNNPTNNLVEIHDTSDILIDYLVNRI